MARATPPRAVPARPGNAQIGAPYLTESFDTSDGTTIGPDLSWLRMQVETTRVTPEIYSNTLALNGSESVSTNLRRLVHLRAEEDAAGTDVRASVTWSNVGVIGDSAGMFSHQEIGLHARTVNTPGVGSYDPDPVLWESGIFLGYWLLWGESHTADPFLELDFSWFSVADDNIYTLAAAFDETGIPAPNSGDELSLTLTGTGSATTAVVAINGTDWMTVTATELDAAAALASATLDYDDLPLGLRGGIYMLNRKNTAGGNWTTANDYVNRIDSFSICPA
jgi:hypothetical protein